MSKNLFLRLAQVELVLLFIVVIAGSVVRMTGSGMGCPDWPKCFGYLVPPTEESQVLWSPEREFKKGQMIVHDQALYKAKNDFTTGQDYVSGNWEKYTVHNYATFNPAHTWIEYINRLFGAISGIPMFLLFVMSLVKVKTKPIYLVLSALGLFGLGFEAWLGKVVVDGNLVPHQITYHMLGAIFLIAVMVTFIYFLRRNELSKTHLSKSGGVFILSLALLLLAQIVMGTQIREEFDLMQKSLSPRDLWVDQLGVVFYIHRSFSLVLILSAIYFWWRWNQKGIRIKSFDGVIVIMSVAIVSGAAMAYFGVPKLLQPTHLFLSLVMFALLWSVWLRIQFSKK